MLKENLMELVNARKVLTYITQLANQYFCEDSVLADLIKIRSTDKNGVYKFDNLYPKDFLKDLGCFNIKTEDDWMMLMAQVPRTPLRKHLHFSSKQGFYIHRDRFTIPVKDHLGNVLTWVSYKKGATHKYVTSNTYGFSKEVQFFGDYIQAKQLGYCIVVEGMFDRIRLASLGYPALALMGLDLNAYRKSILNEIGFIIFIRDNDRAGKSVIAEYDTETGTISDYGTWKVDCDSYDYVLSECKDIDEYLGYKKNIIRFENDIKRLLEVRGLEFKKIG